MPTPFSDKIRILRKGSGLSAPRAAQSLGVSRATLYGWESGEHQPDPEQCAALIRLYGCDEATELRLWRLRSGAETAVEVAA